MNETGFYAVGTWGTEPARVAAVARHLPDAVVYVVGRSTVRNLFGFHGVTTVVPKCATPGCVGLSPKDLDAWLRARHPQRLVMDSTPYGAIYDDARGYVTTRRDPTFYLYRRNTHDIIYQATDFDAVLKADPSPTPGIDLYPLLPFDAEELPTRTEARVTLGATDRPMVVLIGEGTTPEINQFVIRQCDQRGLDHVVVATYPTMPLMVGADLVVGYAGYSQTEAAAVGAPMAAVTNRTDGGQSWRANTTAAELAVTIAALDVRDAPETVTYMNNSRRAAALISGRGDWETIDG